MKKLFIDLASIEKDYHMIDSSFMNGERWRLYEHDFYGEEVRCIAVNLTKGVYTYTWETLTYTIENLDEEYELFKLNE